MTKSLRTTLALATTLTLLAGCNLGGQVTTDTPPENPEDVETANQLEALLQSEGHYVSDSGREEIEIPTGEASKVFRTDGGILYMYEFQDSSNANEARRIIGENESIQTTETWSGPPHFYGNDVLIVVYVGSDAEMIASLKEVFGEQFAGVDESETVDTGDASDESAASSEESSETDDETSTDAELETEGEVDLSL